MVNGLRAVLNDVADYQEDEMLKENNVTGCKEETKMAKKMTQN